MIRFAELIKENNAMLTAYWDDMNKNLIITRSTGVIFRVSSTMLSDPNIRIFGVQVKNNIIEVFVSPKNNPVPIKKLMFSNSGIYRGTSNNLGQ